MTQAESPRLGLRFEYAALLLLLAGALLLGAGFQALNPFRPDATSDAVFEERVGLLAATERLNATPLPGPSAAATEPGIAAAPNSTPDPFRVTIPSIGVHATIVDLGLDDEGRLEVPEDWMATGWFTGRSVPGEPGTSVIVGHVDSAASGPAVFYRLRELAPGDLIEVVRTDGSIAQFGVTEVTAFSKEDFPTDRVYQPTEEPTLRLITCGGDFDRKARSYSDNVVVFATHLGTRAPAQTQS